MKKTLIGIAFVIGYLSFVITAAAVAVPGYINYQGLLRDSAGNVVTGTKSMTFKIYDSLTGGSARWTMTDSAVSVSNGLYTVKLGPLTSTDVGTGSRWLEVVVGSETLTPRLEILSVAYAITAGSVASVDYATLAGTATTAASADTLDTYHAGVSGVSIVPTTDATTGKLSASVIPGSGFSTDYATLSGTASTAATVSDGAITAAKLGSGAVTTAKIGAGAVTTAEIGSAAVTTAKIAPNAVTTTEISSAAVTTAKIAAGAVTTAEIGAGAVTGAKLASNIAISTTGAITTEGKMTIKTLATTGTGTGFCVGTGTIASGATSTDPVIPNTLITNSSIIILTVGHAATTATGNTNGGIRVSAINAGTSFTVSTMNNANASADIPFSYLIIN